MPFEIASEDERSPLRIKFPAPEAFVPMPKWDAVPEPPVHWGNWTSAVLLIVDPERVQPPDVRATATRAYEV
jgi:hypothetical protein